MPRLSSLALLALVLAVPAAPAAAPFVRVASPGISVPSVGLLGNPAWRQKSDNVLSVSFHSDGKTLITINSRGAVQIWDYPSGKLRQHVPTNDAWLADARYTRDERAIVLTGYRSSRLWDLVAGKEHRINLKEAGSAPLVVCPFGKLVAYQEKDRDNKVSLSSFVMGKFVRDLEGHTAALQAVAFSPDARTVATAAADGTIRLWDVATGKQLEGWKRDEKKAQIWLLFSPDGKHLAVSEGKGVSVWTRKGACVARSGGEAVGRRFAFSPDGKLLALGETPGRLWFWDWAADKDVRRLHPGTFYNALAFSPDGKTLAVAPAKGPILFWDVATGAQKYKVSGGHQETITGLHYSPDGKTLASLSRDQTVRFWDVAKRKEVLALEELTNQGKYAAFSPDGRLAASLNEGNGVSVWKAGEAKQSWSIPTKDARARPWGLAFSPDGKSLAVSRINGEVWLYDTATRKGARKFEASPQRQVRLAFSPDGRYLAGYGPGGTLRLWDVEGKRKWDPDLHAENADVEHLCFSPDGKLFLAYGKGERVKPAGPTVWVFETATKEMRSTSSGPQFTQGIRAAAFSPDGRVIAVSNNLGHVIFSDLAAGIGVQLLTTAGPATAIAWRPDGKELALGGDDGLIQLWDATKLVPRIVPAAPTKLTAGEVRALFAELAHENASPAGEALRKLARRPQESVPWLARLKREVDPAKVRKLLDGLDDDDADTRDGASEALEELGPNVAPALRAELKRDVSAEVKRRARELLLRFAVAEKIETDPLLACRVVELLERLNTLEAHALVRQWADAKQDTELTRQAKATVKRWDRLMGKS